MKKVVLRILMASSPHVMSVVMSEDDARSKMEQWKSTNPPAYFSGYDTDGQMYYAIRVNDICVMFTNDLEALKRQQEEAQRKVQAGQPSVPTTYRP